MTACSGERQDDEPYKSFLWLVGRDNVQVEGSACKENKNKTTYYKVKENEHDERVLL